MRENNRPERDSNSRSLTFYVSALPTELSARSLLCLILTALLLSVSIQVLLLATDSSQTFPRESLLGIKVKAYIHITGDNLFIKNTDILEDIIKQVIIDIQEKKKKAPYSNLILREAEVKNGLNYKTAKGVLDQMAQDNKIIVNTENSHFINNKSYSTSESEINEIYGSIDSDAILQHTPPTTNASGKQFASQEGGCFPLLTLLMLSLLKLLHLDKP